MPKLTLAAISKRYPSGGGVTDVSLDVADGEHLVIVGPSGAGKTTLLRLIAGLETPDSGSIWFDDRDITEFEPHLRHVGFAGQKPALYPHLDVRGNLAAGVTFRQASGRWWRWLRGKGDAVSRQELDARVLEVAAWLGLVGLLDRRVQDLSGGEQQRVALGRILVARCPIWLLDEPLIHLDAPIREALRGELLLLRDRLRPTIIEVTHDPVDALTFGHRVAVLLAGRVAQVGHPAEVHTRPASRGVAKSLGWPPMNIIDGSLAVPGEGAAEAVFRALAGDEPRIQLGLRADDVLLGSGTNGCVSLGDWRLDRSLPTGPAGLWIMTQGERRLMRWACPGDQVEESMPLYAAYDRCHWFDWASGRRTTEVLERGSRPTINEDLR